MLKRLKLGQNIRDDGPKSHMKKAGTPTMGGIFFTIPIAVVALLLSRENLDYVVAAVLVMLGFGLIGFIDDFIKVYMKRSLGLKAYQKILGQIGIAVIFSYYVYNNIGSSVYIPFFGNEWDLGVWYIPIMSFIIIGTVNSVNLNDGLDGLAAGDTLIVSVTMSIIASYASVKANDEGLAYLAVNYRNLMIFSGAMAGACLGFLRFNAYPARVFMGDTGAMALGGAVVSIMVLMKLPLLLPVIGGIYMV
jgi:phospho-N-acetylmuramoyl-pentapeptide-transferase